MNYLKLLLKQVKSHELVVGAVLIVYILAGVSTPDLLADFIDTTIGSIAVIVLSGSLFVNVHPVLGVIGLVAAYELLKRSGLTTGKGALLKYLPTEYKKGKVLTAMNQFPLTLEEEVVRTMAPLSRNLNLSQPSYKPVLNDDVGGSKI